MQLFKFTHLNVAQMHNFYLESNNSVQTITLKLRKQKDKDKFGPIGNFLWIDIHVSTNSHDPPSRQGLDTLYRLRGKRSTMSCSVFIVHLQGTNMRFSTKSK